MIKPKTNTDEKLIEKRCSNCNALLAKASLQNGKVEIKCRCGTVNTFQAATEIKTESRPREVIHVQTDTGAISTRT